MQNSVKALLIAISLVGLSACSVLDRLVYKIDIPQGNYVDASKVEQLRIDMNKAQVRYLLGSPMLVDSFSPDRWYYIYSYQTGKGELERRDLVLHFNQERLEKVEGDLKLSDAFMQPLDD